MLTKPSPWNDLGINAVLCIKLVTSDWLYLGRGMNAAFAIGRLLDIDHGKEMLSRNQNAEKMVNWKYKSLAINKFSQFKKY